MERKRQSNIELLRIISMILVMVVHADFKALGIPSQNEIVDFPVSSFMRFFIESISIVCVNLFILISGWFGIRFKLKRLVELLFQILFVFVILSTFLFLNGDIQSLDVDEIIKQFCEDYWFIWAYIALYLFSPALNYFVEKETKKNIALFLILFYIFQTIWGFIIPLAWFSRGYSPISFMGLYILGRYMHLYPNKYTERKQSSDLLMYLGMVLLTTSLAYFMSIIRIDPFKAYSYSSPLVIIESVYLFLFFKKMSFNSQMVNWIATSCLSVYLVHCFPMLFEWVYLYQIKEWFDSMGTIPFVTHTFLWIGFIFLLSVAIDKLRIYIWHKTPFYRNMANYKSDITPKTID